MGMKTCKEEGCNKPKMRWNSRCHDCWKKYHREYMAEWRKTHKPKRLQQGKPPTKGDARGDFIYQNGYRLNVIDLGITGIKLELESDVDCAAIMLPPEKRIELGNWLIAGMQCG